MLPSRTSLIPKHITIDSEILIQNFKSKIKQNLDKFPKEINNVESLRRNFTSCQSTLWNLFFNTDKKINKNYQFDYLLKTDNVSCSLQFAIKTDEKKQRFKKGINKKLDDKTKNKTVKAHKNIKYVDDALEENKTLLDNKKIVCIDPNKGDLIYSGTYINEKFVSFRYTNNQRKKEKKTKKYEKIRKVVLKPITKIAEEKTQYKNKEINKAIVIENIKKGEKLDEKLKKKYEEPIFRKLNLNSYINTQKSESKLINNFRNKMGFEKDTVVIIGDNGLKDVIVKGLESTLSKGIINIFKKSGYETYIIDEFRTSLLCNNCENKLSKFLDVESKKPRTKGKIYKSHGILRCQSSTQTCNVIHNRDKNAVKNMLKLTYSYKSNQKRLERYSRKFSF